MPNVNQHNLNLEDSNVKNLIKVVGEAVSKGTDFDQHLYVVLFHTGLEGKEEGIFDVCEMTSMSNAGDRVEKQVTIGDAAIVREDEMRTTPSLNNYIAREHNKNLRFGVLDGLHRVYALLCYYKEHSEDKKLVEKLMNTQLSLTYYVLHSKQIIYEGSENVWRYARLNRANAKDLMKIFSALSLEIGKNKQKSVDRTLKDLFNSEKGVVGTNKVFYSNGLLRTVDFGQKNKSGVVVKDSCMFAYLALSRRPEIMKTSLHYLRDVPKQILQDLLCCNKFFDYASPAFKNTTLTQGVNSLLGQNFQKYFKIMDEYWFTNKTGDIGRLIQVFDAATVKKLKAQPISFPLETIDNLTPKIYYLLRSIEPGVFCEEFKLEVQNFVDIADQEENGLKDERMLSFAAIAEDMTKDWVKHLKVLNSICDPEDQIDFDGKTADLKRIFYNNIMAAVYKCFNLLCTSSGSFDQDLVSKNKATIESFKNNKAAFCFKKKDHDTIVKYMHLLLYTQVTKIPKAKFDDLKSDLYGPEDIHKKGRTEEYEADGRFQIFTML